MKTAIVTGANGFVGSALCKELSINGYNIIALVKNRDSNIDSIKSLNNLSLVYCDMSDYLDLEKSIKQHSVDIFFHLAWSGSSGPLRKDENTQLTNIKSTCNAVHVCNKLGIKRFIYAGSIMEYEAQNYFNNNLDMPINTIYSTAKLTADYMAKALACNYNIDYISCTISNIYGPGENSLRLINSSIRNLLNNIHCSFSEGLQQYDFIYISDAAKAFVELAEKGKNNKNYYIGSLNPRPLKDFLTDMRDVVSPNQSIGLGEIPYNGLSLNYNNIDLLAVKNDTGFEPQISFKDGIRMTAEWIRQEIL